MKLKIILICLISLSFYGCNNLAEQVEVRIEPELYADPWTDEFKDRTYIIITSFTDQPVEIQHISINRGACTSKLAEGNRKLSQYGSFNKMLLLNCNIGMVKEVQLTMNRSDYVYNF